MNMGVASDLLKALFRPVGQVASMVNHKPPDLLMFEAAQRRLKRSTIQASREADAFGAALDDIVKVAQKKRRGRNGTK